MDGEMCVYKLCNVHKCDAGERDLQFLPLFMYNKGT